MKKLILLILFMVTAPAFAGDFDSDCLDQNNEGREFVQEESVAFEDTEEEVVTENNGIDV